MKQIALVIVLVACISCKKGGTGTTVTPPVPTPAPAKAVQLLPAINSTCTDGRIVSASQIGVFFTWNSAANANSYELIIKNLITGATLTQSTPLVQLEVILSRGAPYSWYIVSKASGSAVTATSDTWKFYAAGEAIANYAPFPAELVSPTLDQTVNASGAKVTLDWNGADVDGDIAGYDIYFGLNSANLPLLKANSTESIITDVAISAGNNYYWKIISKDSKGNSSVSEIFRFKTN